MDWFPGTTITRAAQKIEHGGRVDITMAGLLHESLSTPTVFFSPLPSQTNQTERRRRGARGVFLDPGTPRSKGARLGDRFDHAAASSPTTLSFLFEGGTSVHDIELLFLHINCQISRVMEEFYLPLVRKFIGDIYVSRGQGKHVPNEMAGHPRTTVQHLPAGDTEELPSRYVLREQHRHGGILAAEEMPEPLPVVDISRLPAADEADKLRAALERWGLFLVRN